MTKKKPANLFIDVAKNGAKQTPVQDRVDLSDVQLTKEPYTQRRNVNSKYADIFSRVSKNERIKCPAGKAGGIGHTLRSWLNRHVCDDAIVTTRERCDDGYGGVWWMGEREEAPAQKSKKTREESIHNTAATSATSPWAGIK